MSFFAQSPRLFSVPAGVSFLPAFATALLDGVLVPGFPDRSDPLALSAARIFVPTRRAAKALASEIARRQGATAAILPQILPLGSLAEAEEAGLFDPVSHAEFAAASANEAIGDLDRRLILTELILKWGSAIRHAICHIDEAGNMVLDDTETFSVLRAPGQAFYLARELAALIDEILIEGVEWNALRNLVPNAFDRYWSITLDFLKIVAELWPRHLQERGLVDSAQRRMDMIRAEAKRLQNNLPQGPMIVAGSTGTNAATAELIATISRLPQGAVVLPGLDKYLDDAAWQALAADTGTGKLAEALDTRAGHPQATLARLLRRLGVGRGDIRDLAQPQDALDQRMRFVSEALRPAETTEKWNAYRQANTGTAIEALLANVTYIDAENERAEALAIAVAMREALEDPAQTAALITPDRNLARRVRAELKRWDITVDDSGGESLFSQPAGILATLALSLLEPSGDGATAAALLHHNDMRLALSGHEFRRLAELTEVAVLRGADLRLDDVEAMIRHGRLLQSDAHAHPAKKAISDEDWMDIARFLTRLRDALTPLSSVSGCLPVKNWFALHAEVFRTLTAPPQDVETPASEDRAALDAVFRSFEQTADRNIQFDLPGYRALFESVLREATVRGPQASHPRLKILGLLEARLLPAGMKILAGMDEGVWPPAAKNDAFLNRPMREALGLTPPERRNGQTAHDFVDGMGAEKVIVTRARKRGDAPAIPSRLIQRMEALAGDAWGHCLERGEKLLHWAEMLDTPEAKRTIARPEPKPPLELRPQRMSVTEIETWRRDPYAIYAQKILRLQKLDAPGSQQSIADIGTAVHAVLAAFHRGATNVETFSEAKLRIERLAENVLAEYRKNEIFDTFKWPRIKKALQRFVEWNDARQSSIATIFPEIKGETDFVLDDGSRFVLNARADRVDVLQDGSVALIDYKTGNIPTAKQTNAGFAPQLTLEATIATQGGFREVPAGSPVSQALFLKIKDDNSRMEHMVGERKGEKPLATLIEEHRRGLLQLANQFRNSATAYPPRPYPQFEKQYNDYDHLARVKEWQAGPDGGEE